jgi:hypothetical protein
MNDKIDKYLEGPDKDDLGTNWEKILLTTTLLLYNRKYIIRL